MRAAVAISSLIILGVISSPITLGASDVPDKIGPICLDQMPHYWDPDEGEVPVQYYESNGAAALSEFVPDASAGIVAPGSDRPMPGTLHIQIACDLHEAVKECVEGLLSVNAERIQDCIDGATTP